MIAEIVACRVVPEATLIAYRHLTLRSLGRLRQMFEADGAASPGPVAAVCAMRIAVIDQMVAERLDPEEA